MPNNLTPENDDSLSLNVSAINQNEKKEADKLSVEPKPIIIAVEKKQERMILNQNPDRQSIKHKINLTKPPKAKKEKLEIPPITEIKTEKPSALEMPEITTKTPVIEEKTTLNIPEITAKTPVIEEKTTLNIPEITAKTPVIEEKTTLNIPEIPLITESPKLEIVPENKPQPLFDLNDFPSIVMKEEDLEIRLELPKKEVKKKENKVEDKAGKFAVAWLILHTENQEPIYFDLFEGLNVIGRGEPKRPADIEIQNDQYVSRFHAHLKINQTAQKIFIYALYDGVAQPPKPSLNGVYVNGNKERLRMNDAHYLKDGDTLQIGLTKLVFKSREMTGNIEEAFTQVVETEYTQTVIIK
jgi:pSer/pThr/pTyr-binding forkhead associated (FHA) protein